MLITCIYVAETANKIDNYCMLLYFRGNYALKSYENAEKMDTNLQLLLGRMWLCLLIATVMQKFWGEGMTWY